MLSRLIIPLLLLSSTLLAEAPWGKDAQLIHWQPNPPCRQKPPRSALSLVGEKMIRFHQTVISPSDGPRSHYVPSSSEYTRQAMVKYGFFKGFLYGCDRLMRENNDPWVYPKVQGHYMWMKYDPVP